MQGPHLTNSQETFLANEILWTVREGRKTENVGLRCRRLLSPSLRVFHSRANLRLPSLSFGLRVRARARASLKFHPNVDVTRDD